MKLTGPDHTLCALEISAAPNHVEDRESHFCLTKFMLRADPKWDGKSGEDVERLTCRKQTDAYSRNGQHLVQVSRRYKQLVAQLLKRQNLT